eukprot:COSAG01_NODE_389_length_17708_cov_111.404452_5_plen_209_part_00
MKKDATAAAPARHAVECGVVQAGQPVCRSAASSAAAFSNSPSAMACSASATYPGDPILNLVTRNRRDIGKSQSEQTACNMETPGSHGRVLGRARARVGGWALLRRAARCVQNGYLLRRGGCQNRWHSLVNRDHGDSTTTGRFDSPPGASAGRPSSVGPEQAALAGSDLASTLSRTFCSCSACILRNFSTCSGSPMKITCNVDGRAPPA